MNQMTQAAIHQKVEQIKKIVGDEGWVETKENVKDGKLDQVTVTVSLKPTADSPKRIK